MSIIDPHEHSALEDGSRAPTAGGDTGQEPMTGEAAVRQQVDAYLLRIARQAFTASTSYMDANYRPQWQKNLANYNSKHPPGSKYHTAAYQSRSRLFRPKSRASARRNESAFVTAFFTSTDAAIFEAFDEKDRGQVANAALMKHVINTRLETTVPWFKVALGAFQDAYKQGACCSCQEWDYRERNGQVISDTPVVRLVPLENLRFDPAADWTDPVGTSPYLIEMIPMYVSDVQDRMRSKDNKTGQPSWRPMDEAIILTARTDVYDVTRAARTPGQADPKSDMAAPTEYQTVWVHRNIVRVDGEDWMYYTLGTTQMLSDPVPLEEPYPDGRPYAFGSLVLDSHVTLPPSPIELTEDLQAKANHLDNLRFDNLQLVLNKRYFVHRDANVDMDALSLSAPGVTIQTDNMDGVRPDDRSDVTGSSYAEQERVNVDMDELSGTFSVGTVGTSRALSETVGGMNLASGAANQQTEYLIRVFAETWVEPVMRQLVKLEQRYESDAVLLALAGRRAKLFTRYGVSEITEQLLRQNITVKVSVGAGVTDPMQRIQRLDMAVSAIGKLGPNALLGLNHGEVAREIFGAIGHKDGGRFWSMEDEQDPVVQNLKLKVQQLTQMLESGIAVERVRAEGAMQREQVRAQLTKEIERIKANLRYLELLIEAEKNEAARQELVLEKEALLHNMTAKEIELRLQNRRETNIVPIKGERSMSGVLTRNRYGAVPQAVG